MTPAYIATLTPQSIIGQSTPLAVDPNLSNTYTDEYSAGLQHELIRDLGLNVNFVRKFWKNPFERFNLGEPTGGFAPVSAIDFGLDGVRGTSDDKTITVFERLIPAKSDQIVQTFKGHGANFTTVEFNIQKRFSNNWQMLTGFDWTKRNLAPVLRESNDPNVLLWNARNSGSNNFGGHHTSNWTYKLSGSYDLKYGVRLHGIYNAQKGEAYGRRETVNAAALAVPGRTTGLAQGNITIFTEPEGSYFYPTVHLTNFRAEKKFAITEKQSISALFDLFNIFNANTVTGVDTLTGTVRDRKGNTVPRFGRVTQILNPRIFRIGARWSF